MYTLKCEYCLHSYQITPFSLDLNVLNYTIEKNKTPHFFPFSFKQSIEFIFNQYDDETNWINILTIWINDFSYEKSHMEKGLHSYELSYLLISFFCLIQNDYYQTFEKKNVRLFHSVPIVTKISFHNIHLNRQKKKLLPK